MKRIFDDFAYGDGPRAGCWWDETHPIPRRAALGEGHNTDVVVVGGGFTGLSAALHLATAGISVTVLEAEHIGWGASGRNGGFCCLGGGMASDADLDRRFGKQGRIDFRRTELAATHLVAQIAETHDIEVDRHSDGETALAHRAKDMAGLTDDAATLDENYGVKHSLHSKAELHALGMAGPFHGGITIHAGFGLNPRKYVAGLAQAASDAGAQIFERTPVTRLAEATGGWEVDAGGHTVKANQVIIATNGYSSEDIPPLAGEQISAQPVQRDRHTQTNRRRKGKRGLD